MATLHPNFIVGIGGSAGSLSAFKALLSSLSSETNMSFIFVSHLYPSANSQLAQILARQTKMPVRLATNEMPIERNSVYVIPPDADLYIEENYTFKVVSPRRSRNTQIDTFFSSLADCLGIGAIGIVLSGYDGDGTKGCKQIKSKGGITFAQDKSAEVGSMPLSAQVGGNVDFVMAPEKIALELQRIAKKLLP